MLKQQSILIVDDEQNFSKLLGKRLEFAGYKVYIADSAEAGNKIAMLKNISLISTDVNMPKVNGYEFCQKLSNQKKTKHIPVVMLSGNDDANHRQKGLASGASEYLVKPFDPVQFELSINKLLRQR